MTEKAISDEVARLKAQFEGADVNKMAALDSLIHQAAFEKVYLQELNKQALKSGLVKFHPENASLQQALPISKAITQHSATLTHLLDRLCKHLGVAEEEDDDLAEFE